MEDAQREPWFLLLMSDISSFVQRGTDTMLGLSKVSTSRIQKTHSILTWTTTGVGAFPILTKRWQIPCQNRSCFICFTRALHATEQFAMTQHFTKMGDTPCWHLCVPKGAEMTSWGVCLSQPYLQALVVCYGRHCLNTTNHHAS